MGFERIGEINDIITITPTWQELDLTGKQAIVGMVELDDVAVAIRTDTTSEDAYVTVQPGQPFPPPDWRFGLVEVRTAPYETEENITSHLQLINHLTSITTVMGDVQVGITMSFEQDTDFEIPEGSTRRLLIKTVNLVTGLLYTPERIRYKITDLQTGDIIRPFVDISPVSGETRVLLTKEDNSFHNNETGSEEHIITVSVEYEGEEVENAELKYMIMDLVGITGEGGG